MGLCVCLSGVWTGVGVEKVGWECVYLVFGQKAGVEKVGCEYDYVFIWCLDSWCGESWVEV